MPTPLVNFRLSPDTRATLEKLAGDRNMSKTAVVELAICQLAEQGKRIDPTRIKEAIEALRALRSSAARAGIGL